MTDEKKKSTITFHHASLIARGMLSSSLSDCQINWQEDYDDIGKLDKVSINRVELELLAIVTAMDSVPSMIGVDNNEQAYFVLENLQRGCDGDKEDTIFCILIATENVSGYLVTQETVYPHGSYEPALMICKEMNEKIGISEERAEEIVTSTMF